MVLVKKGDQIHLGYYKPQKQEDLLILFQPCMYNKLMTFYKVGFATNKSSQVLLNADRPIERLVNHAHSDNVGPIGIANYGFHGGNHSFRERGKTRTAKMDKYQLVVDGTPLYNDTTLRFHTLEVKVENTLFYGEEDVPNTTYILSTPLAKESVLYTIHNGVIEVETSLTFKNRKPLTVERYYGAQSMFIGDSIRVLPSTDFSFQKRVAKNVLKKENPKLHTFIQKKNENDYETVYLDPTVGIGDHSLIAEDKPILISAGYGKVYHTLIFNHQVTKGDKINWRAIYSWE